MVDVKGAVEAALSYFGSLYSGKGFEDILVEEVEAPNSHPFWRITVGFSRRLPSRSHLDAIKEPKYERDYKLLQVDPESGEVTSMKIRKP